jgi:hypothetical protein
MPPSVGFALAQGPRHYLFDTVHNGDSLAPGVLASSEFSSSMIIMTELRR